MVEGRCQLSSYVTGASPNRHGVCSPASFVRWDERDDGSRSVRLNNVLIDAFQPEEPAGNPTVCKGRFEVGNRVFHRWEEHKSEIQPLMRIPYAVFCLTTPSSTCCPLTHHSR